MLIAPFRKHHDDPKEITRISLLENLGSSAIAGTCVFLTLTDKKSENVHITDLKMSSFSIFKNEEGTSYSLLYSKEQYSNPKNDAPLSEDEIKKVLKK